MAWVGRDLKDHPVPTFCHRQNCQLLDHCIRLHRAPSNLALNTSRDGRGIHSLSEQPVQNLTTLIGKTFLLISNLNLPSFSLKPFFLVLSLSTLLYSPPVYTLPSKDSAPSREARALRSHLYNSKNYVFPLFQIIFFQQ